ncbi:MAG: FtsX-like permease family protein, partial [Bryobacteraceae bacterium]
NTPLGFRAEHILTVSLPLRGTPYEKGPRYVELERTLTEEFRRIPGVMAVGTTNALPPNEFTGSGVFSREDRPPFDRGDRIYMRTVDPPYYVALGIPLLRGRLFTAQEIGNNIPVAIVNETLARRYFPNEDPLGKGIMGQFDHKWKKIVGVVADTKNHGLRDPIEAEMDQPQPDAQSDNRDAKFLIRTAGDPRASMDAVRGELREFDKNLPATIRTMERQVDEEVAGPRFHTLLLSIFAAVAVALAAVGIYGVMSYSVARRTQEIGIRMALGAEPGDVLRLVMRQAALVTAAGIGLGLAGAFAATRYLASLLYGVTARDAGIFVGVALLLAAIALAASFVPARRATSVDGCATWK